MACEVEQRVVDILTTVLAQVDALRTVVDNALTEAQGDLATCQTGGGAAAIMQQTLWCEVYAANSDNSVKAKEAANQALMDFAAAFPIE